jgi:hypothetical protein
MVEIDQVICGIGEESMAFVRAGPLSGRILSTLLTLLIVPPSFSLAIGFERWSGPHLRKRLLPYQPGDEHGPRAPTPHAAV